MGNYMQTVDSSLPFGLIFRVRVEDLRLPSKLIFESKQ
jgi:hypothetical protein